MLISSCVLGLLLTIAHPANAQHSVNITNKTIAQAIKVIEGNTGYKFFYAENLPDFNKKVNFKIDNKSIETILTSLLICYQKSETNHPVEKNISNIRSESDIRNFYNQRTSERK